MRYTIETARSVVFRHGCYPSKLWPTVIELPKIGPGIRVWGALEYLVNHCGYVTVRE